ncbi:hypothetical protein VTO73DRAFT_14538 [Trametes versicolor]
MIPPPHPYSVGRSTGSHRGRNKPRRGCYKRDRANRAIARHKPPVRPHTTLGYDSPPIATPSSLRVRPRRALHGLETPSYVYKGPSISDSDIEHPPCHLRVDLQPRRPVPARRFWARWYLPTFRAEVFSNAHTPGRAFLRP